LAESLNSGNSKFKYIPVFWLETEDHDFQEINHFGLFNKDSQPKQLSYNGKDLGKVSLRHYQLDDSISTLLSEIEENLLDTEFSKELFDKIKENYKPNQDWTSAVRQFLKEIFSSYGLLFFQPGAEEIKNISTQFFTELVLKGEEIKNIFDRQSSDLTGQGYHNQVKSIPGQTFIHLERENRQRGHLYKEGDDYYFKDSDYRYTQSEVLKLIEDNPTIVSSTVASRPLLQSWLLPVAAYIAGPGEIAYWAQLMQMFSVFELAQPVLYPRISATVIEPKVSRYIEKYAVDIKHLPLKRNEFIEKYFKNLSENEGDDPFRNLNNILEAEGQKLDSYIKSLDPTLIDLGKKSMERIKQTLENLENRLIKVKEQREGNLTNHLQQIHMAFFPDEAPQERFLSVIYFLNKFGPVFMDRLYSELELDNFDHQLLYL
jgi:bacillithiol biosynthesis cysteine-adding enzyme BshC